MACPVVKCPKCQEEHPFWYLAKWEGQCAECYDEKVLESKLRGQVLPPPKAYNNCVGCERTFNYQTLERRNGICWRCWNAGVRLEEPVENLPVFSRAPYEYCSDCGHKQLKSTMLSDGCQACLIEKLKTQRINLIVALASASSLLRK